MELLSEGRSLQDQLALFGKKKRSKAVTRHEESETDHLSQTFSRCMRQGRVKSALRLLSEPERGQVLPLDEVLLDGSTVRDVLKQKHPPAGVVQDEALVERSTQSPPHAVIFDKIDGLAVRTAALHSQGGAGPSGLDASNWSRMCTMFHGHSKKLCIAIAGMARRLCTDYVDPELIQPLIACRLRQDPPPPPRGYFSHLWS